MKKITALIIIVLIALLNISVFAGSVPEDLLSSEESQVFFAKVEAYHLNNEKNDIEISPVKVLKGNVNTGTKVIYSDPFAVGDFEIKTGDVYLFAYYDENNPTYIFETTINEDGKLELKGAQGDMWERFEQYLNDGQYEEAQIKQNEEENAKQNTSSEETSVIGGADAPTDIYVKGNVNIFLIIIIIFIILIIGIVLFISKKRK